MIPLLHEIEKHWPGLSIRDLVGAFVLAEVLVVTGNPRGRA
jgi:hypothetical protein